MQELILAVTDTSSPLWVAHPDLTRYAFYALWVIVILVVNRSFKVRDNAQATLLQAQAIRDQATLAAMQGLTDAQSELFERMGSLERETYILIGEHRVNHKSEEYKPRPYSDYPAKENMIAAMQNMEDAHAHDAEDSD